MKQKPNLYLRSLLAVTMAALMALPSGAAVFAKSDGIDGESADPGHEQWINVLGYKWGMHRPLIDDGSAAAGSSRRRGDVIVEDITMTIEYEKAMPKLQEKCLMGEVIPKLEIEQTANYGGSRATYLKYELTNVMITSVSVNASGNDGDGPPVVVVGCNFEEIKVTYTEFDKDSGAPMDTTEFQWTVEETAG